ncbi:MAG: DUF4266 domain-containing protein [Nannocystis sp.]|jgi:hypothetical protein|nr:DUF4266 domain-containing protein [Nannocystis sp.]
MSTLLPPRLRARHLAVAVAVAATQLACVTVRPSERQVLSTPEMDPSRDGPEEIWHSHVESAREGGFGGHGAAGGGCGCG